MKALDCSCFEISVFNHSRLNSHWAQTTPSPQMFNLEMISLCQSLQRTLVLPKHPQPFSSHCENMNIPTAKIFKKEISLSISLWRFHSKMESSLTAHREPHQLPGPTGLCLLMLKKWVPDPHRPSHGFPPPAGAMQSFIFKLRLCCSFIFSAWIYVIRYWGRIKRSRVKKLWQGEVACVENKSLWADPIPSQPWWTFALSNTFCLTVAHTITQTTNQLLGQTVGMDSMFNLIKFKE